MPKVWPHLSVSACMVSVMTVLLSNKIKEKWIEGIINISIKQNSR
jgi:hypothetical protein